MAVAREFHELKNSRVNTRYATTISGKPGERKHFLEISKTHANYPHAYLDAKEKKKFSKMMFVMTAGAGSERTRRSTATVGTFLTLLDRCV